MRLLVSLGVVCLAATAAHAQNAEETPTDLDRVRKIVAENTLDIALIDGVLSGPGMDALVETAEGARFVLIGEPHNTDQVNQFTAALFRALHDELGFDYVVLEQDPWLMDRYGETPFRGDLAAIRADAPSRLLGFHFATDGELALLAEIGATSTGPGSPLWGVDRIMSAEHALERLAALIDDPDDKAKVDEILAHARAHNAEALASFDPQKAQNKRFMMAEDAEFDDLLTTLDVEAGTEAAKLLHALRVSRENFREFLLEHDDGDPWGYANNLQRENLMKRNLARRLSEARTRGETPKAVVKLGHWHAVEGPSPTGFPSVGDAAAGWAALEGGDTVSIAITLANHPGQHWSVTDFEDFALIHEVADPDAWRLVDLRPLRPYVWNGDIALAPNAAQYVNGFDYLLIIGGTNPGGYSWIEEAVAEGRFP